MSRSTLTMAVAVTVLLVAPLAGAKWMSFGTYEPDTIYDTSKYMVQDDPGTAINSTVYFNAFQKTTVLGFGIINPNSGQLETRFGIPSTVQAGGGATGLNFHEWSVLMGVWTDCNGDGYIGMAETAVNEYHARVLRTPLSTVGETVCEAKTSTSVTPSAYAAAGMPNNYNSWVTEFLPIGGIDYAGSASDARVFFDIEAKVWADAGVPDAPVGAPPAASAPCQPIRAENEEDGEAHSTGAMLWSLDCRGQRSVGATPQVGPVPGQSGVPVSFIGIYDGATAGTGLEFGPSKRHSNSPLNQELGSEDADNGVIVKAQDCGSGHFGENENEGGDPELFNTRQVLDGNNDGSADVPATEDFNDLTLLRPVPQQPVNTNPATWSVPATVNYTRESGPESPGNSGGSGPGRDTDCNFDNDDGRDFYGPLEANPQQFQETGKVAADANLVFLTSARGSATGVVLGAGSGGGDPNAGVHSLAGNCGASSCLPSMWTTGAGFLNPSLLRVDLTAPENSGLPVAPYVTFYGYLGSASQGRWTMPNAGERYGEGPNSCEGQQSGEANNWQCDDEKWYVDAENKPIRANPIWCDNTDADDPCPGWGLTDAQRPLARVHDLFTFRDVDCIDGRIGNTGVGTLPAFFGGACDVPQ